MQVKVVISERDMAASVRWLSGHIDGVRTSKRAYRSDEKPVPGKFFMGQCATGCQCRQLVRCSVLECISVR